jgi:GR25 family glycosyltransferase involved in LPS biosynthesis
MQVVTKKAPVLVIGFSRPDLLSASLQKLVGSGRPVYIAIDGPRNQSDVEAVNKCRELARNFSDSNCAFQTVKLLIRETNYGCKVGVRSAIDWIFEHEEQAIILEDDIDFADEFLVTMDSWLHLFRSRKDIFHLNGYNPLPIDLEPDVAYLSRYTHVWGWATWKDRWAFYDRDLIKWDSKELRTLPGLIGQDLSDAFFEYWSMQVALCQNGLDTWDVQWLFSQWLYGGFALTPGSRLTGNRGFDKRATHTALSGNIHRERLPVFHNYKFLHPKDPFLNLPLNEMHDEIENNISSKNKNHKNIGWKITKKLARIFLVIAKIPTLNNLYNSFLYHFTQVQKLMLLSLGLVLKIAVLKLFVTKVCKYVYWRLIRPKTVGAVLFVTKVCKYVYWRLIRPKTVGAVLFVTKVCKYIYWRLIRFPFNSK